MKGIANAVMKEGLGDLVDKNVGPFNDKLNMKITEMQRRGSSETLLLLTLRLRPEGRA